MNGSLVPMKITGYTDEDFQQTFKGKPYSVMINPDSIKWNRSIEYSEKNVPDSPWPSQKYKNTPSEKLSFDIVIDCTGLVNDTRTDLMSEVNALKEIIYSYNGSKHRPNFVQVQWGKDITFQGVLTGFDTSYTLFRPDGSPLRAKLSLSFSRYVSAKTAAKMAHKQSPDVSHRIVVEQGMTLPQLCQNIWNDDSYYVQVAQYNDLNKFRNLRGGELIIFPPLLQPA